MKPFTQHTGIVAPIDRINVDTDLIIPKQFLKSIKRTGFGVNLFDQLRYLDEGQPEMDTGARPINPNFILNQPPFTDASILLVRDNFGCGSSREHAVWALKDYGFNVIIGASFADIFHNNCFKNGVLPITLTPKDVDHIFALAANPKGLILKVNLVNQEIELPGGNTIVFDIEDFRKHRLLNGLDDISLTLERSSKIADFEKQRAAKFPWLFPVND